MTATTLTAPHSTFSILRNRNFALLWTGQLISTIGSSLSSLAASILVYRLTGSALSVGLMLIATAAPSIVLGLIAGVFVDRYNRKSIMMGSDLIRAVLIFLIPFLLPFSIAWLYIIVLLSSAVSRFFDPAHASVLPDIASDEELAAANSLIAISSFGSTAVGFAASGLIASAFSIEWAFYIDAVTFVFSALCIAATRIPPLQAQGKTDVATVFRNIRSGFKFLFDTPILRSLFLLFPIIGISFGMWNTLLLPFARQALNATEFEYGLQEGLTSVGFVIGSLMMARYAADLHEGQWTTLSLVGMGLVGAIYATLTSVPPAMVLVMVSGFANAPSAIARNLVVQRNSPREMRGRVASAFFVTRDVSFIVGMGAAGLADMVGVRAMMFTSGLLVLVPGVIAAFLPGLGQAPAEWRRSLAFLRAAHTAPRLAGARPATLADFDLLAGLVPSLGLTPIEIRSLASKSQVYETPAGTALLKHGEAGHPVYFILAGRAVAGTPTGEGEHEGEHFLQPGDFFGENAALDQPYRAANVVAAEPTTLLEAPPVILKHRIAHPSWRELIRHKLHERHGPRVHITDLPRVAGFYPEVLQALRQPHPTDQPASKNHTSNSRNEFS